ncbi:hypothetical protein Q3G72_031942 [Acer saccharum]|nr:hypothetical protein Q3G72_031942 [Acer saccharum]
MEALYRCEELNFGLKLPNLGIILVTLIAIFGGYLKLKFSGFFQNKKLPPGSLGFPLVGETISFMKALKQDKPGEWIQKHVDKYGLVFKTSLMGSEAVVLTGQAGNKFMFSGSDNGIAGNQAVTVANILGKRSIFEVSGYRHKLVRGAIMSFLKPESLQRFVGEMDLLVKQQIFQELQDKESVHMVALMKKITFKVTCSLLFGLPEGNEKDSLFEVFTFATKGLWAVPLNFPGTAYHKALQARGRISKLLSKLIDRRKKQMEEAENSHQDDNIISSLLVLRDENCEPLPEEEIIDNLISMIIASHDTSTILLSLLIRLFARDTKISSKVLEEQKEVVKAREGKDRQLTWSEMQMMKYTWRVAQELMRLTPPVFGNFKCTSRDTSFGGFDIPKGMKVFWMAPGTHMDKNIFEDPENFDPSRFENSSEKPPPYTYIPFGAGPRICPGAEFARIEILLIIHHLITNYQWTEMVPDEPITRDPMPYPARGLPVNIQRRNYP